MSKERTPFTETMAYPVIFMIILSLVFIGILAVLFRMSEGKIERYERETFQKIVLRLCAPSISKATGIDAAQIIQDYPQSYEKYIKVSSLKGEDRPSYAVTIGDSVIVRCVDIPGMGLWEKMRCLVATSDDLTMVKELSIYKQMETPGLGGRIGEAWFQDQFGNTTMILDGKFRDLELIAEKAPREEGQINKVTGATISSNAVINMVKDGLQNLYDQNKTGGAK